MEEKIKKLINAGGREWKTEDGKHRIYFNSDVLAEMYGLSVEYYGTGNISSAKLDGEKISNSSARRYLERFDSGIHYDVVEKKWRANKTCDLGEIVKIIKENAKNQEGRDEGNS